MPELKTQDTFSGRLHTFDILRGFFIILALLQHYTYYNNVWFLYFFRNGGALGASYSFYGDVVGKALPMDGFLYFLSITFIPWVSQIYLTLAAFNLSRRDKLDFRLVMGGKFKIFALLFFFFTLENFLVSPNFGGALSLYPIQTWMLLLGALTLIYGVLGTPGVIGWMILGLIIQAMPTELMDQIEGLLQVLWHPDFEIDARPHYFWVSSCMGFLIGRLYYSKKLNNLKILAAMTLLGVSMCLPYWLGDTPFTVDAFNIFKTEHDLSFSLPGNLYLWGTQLILLSFALKIERMRLARPLPFLTYVGVASLPIFALHRIFYVHIYGPIREFFGAMFGFIPTTNFWAQALAIILVVTLTWFIGRTKLAKLIMERA